LSCTITETGVILNRNQIYDGVKVTINGQETEKILTPLGASQQEAQQPVRSIIIPKYSTMIGLLQHKDEHP